MSGPICSKVVIFFFFFLVDKGCDADLIEAIEFGGKKINSKKAKLSNYI